MKQQILNKTILASLITFASGVALAAPYDIVDLGGLDGNYSVAYEINEQGVVVGTANGPLLETGLREFYSHGVKYNTNGNEDLGVLTDGKASEALSINSSGIAVGYANKFTEVTEEDGTTYSKESLHAVIFDNGVEALPEKENLSLSRAVGINDNNLIIGYGRYDVDPEDETAGVDRGFIYNPVDESYFMVTPLADEASRQAYLTDLNNTGKVLGFSDANVPDTSEYTVQSFIIDTTNANEVTTIPTVDKRATFAQSININDEVVGSVYIRGTRNNQEAFYYDAQSGADTLTFLGFLRSDYTD